MTSTQESFKSRVDKIFGSLTSSPSSSLNSTPWSLSDDDVQRKQWGRVSSDRDDLPCSSSFDQLKKERRTSFCDDEGFKDEWEIRANIGLDSTLDKEEEEDEFDKVATGRENVGDRLYMKDVSDRESYLNFNNVLSNPLHCGKDPRANHMAAKIRLKEDNAEAPELGSFVDYGSKCSEQLQPGKLSGGDAANVKPILKRKKDNSDSKSQKRVRFDPSCEMVTKESVSGEMFDSSEEENDMVLDIQSASCRKHSEVPDYLRNPSKYTRYSFDSSMGVDEKSNAHASMDFLKLVQSSKVTDTEMEQEAAAGRPKSVTFIPRKKITEAEGESNNCEMKLDKEEYGCHQSMQQQQQKGSLAGIAAIESQLSEVDTLAEEEPETNEGSRRIGLQKPGRKYRTKMNSSNADDDSQNN